MSKGYVNGENQDSEAGKKQTANFAEAAKGMGLAIASYAAGEKAIELGKKAIEGATTTEVNETLANYPGEQATKFDTIDLGGSMVFGAAAAYVAYNGRHDIKKAFVYSAKNLYKASKKTLSFAKKAVEELQHLTQEYVAEDKAHPNKPTFFNRVNAFFGKSR